MNDKQKKALEGYNHFISLRSHNLELANLQDVDSFLAAANKEQLDATSELTKAKQMLTGIVNKFIAATTNYNSALKVADDIAKQVKSLGLDMPPDLAKKQSFLKEKSKSISKEFVRIRAIEKSL